jgi:hypothetical protein
MTSFRKAESNRKNSQKSTGPRSEMGRRRSSRNALRHGLAVAIGLDPSFGNDVEILAKSLAGGKAVGEFARQIAETEFDLLRIRKLKALCFKTIFESPEATPLHCTELNDSLAKLERYERRALSRRHRVLMAIAEH